MHKLYISLRNIFQNTGLFLFIVVLIVLVSRTACLVLKDNGLYLRNELLHAMEIQIASQVVGPDTHLTCHVGRNMPVYPLIVLLSYKILGGILGARILNIFFSAFTCLAIYFIGKELSGKTLGKIGALLFALYYPHAYWVFSAHMEIWQTLITILSVYYMILAYKQNTFKYYALAGIVFALSILTKPVPFPFIPVFILLILIKNKASVRKGLVFSLIFLVINIAFLVPVVIRNYHYHKTFLLFTTDGGGKFWEGNQVHYTGGDGGWISSYREVNYTRHPELEDVTLPKPADVKFGEYAVGESRYYFRLGLEFIKRYPIVFLELMPLKFYNMWRFNYAGNRHILRIATEFIGYLLMLPFFFFIGIYYMRPSYLFKEPNPCLIPFLFVILHMLIYLVIAGAIRYRIPAVPCIQIVGLYGIEFFYLKLSKPKVRV